MDTIRLSPVAAATQMILLTRCARTALAAYDLGRPIDVRLDVSVNARIVVTLLVDHVRADQRTIAGSAVREVMMAWMGAGCAVAGADLVEAAVHAMAGNAARLAAVEPAS